VAASAEQTVVLRVGRVLFGLPALASEGILAPPAHVTALPGAPADEPGVFHHGDHTVALVELRRKLGVPDRDGRVVLARTGEALRGFVVDEVLGFAPPEARRTALPPGLPARTFHGALLHDGRIALLTDFEALYALKDAGTALRALATSGPATTAAAHMPLHEALGEAAARLRGRTKPEPSPRPHTTSPQPPVRPEEPVPSPSPGARRKVTAPPPPMPESTAKASSPANPLPSPSATSGPQTPKPRRPGSVKAPLAATPPQARAPAQPAPARPEPRMPANVTPPAATTGPMQRPAAAETNANTAEVPTPVSPPETVRPQAPAQPAAATGQAPETAPRHRFLVPLLATVAAAGLVVVLLPFLGLEPGPRKLSSAPTHTAAVPAINALPQTTPRIEPRLALTEADPPPAPAQTDEGPQPEPQVQPEPQAEPEPVAPIASVPPPLEAVAVTDTPPPAQIHLEPAPDGVTLVMEHNPPSTPGTRVIVHTVVRGDTLWDIAKRYLKDPWSYGRLAEDSAIVDPDVIQVGDKVRIVER